MSALHVRVSNFDKKEKWEGSVKKRVEKIGDQERLQTLKRSCLWEKCRLSKGNHPIENDNIQKWMVESRPEACSEMMSIRLENTSDSFRFSIELLNSPCDLFSRSWNPKYHVNVNRNGVQHGVPSGSHMSDCGASGNGKWSWRCLPHQQRNCRQAFSHSEMKKRTQMRSFFPPLPMS